MLANEQTCAWFLFDVFAPEAVLEERIERRLQKGRDASDATVDVMKQQQETEESFTDEEKAHVLRVDSTDSQAIISAMKELYEKAGM